MVLLQGSVVPARLLRKRGSPAPCRRTTLIIRPAARAVPGPPRGALPRPRRPSRPAAPGVPARVVVRSRRRQVAGFPLGGGRSRGEGADPGRSERSLRVGPQARIGPPGDEFLPEDHDLRTGMRLADPVRRSPARNERRGRRTHRPGCPCRRWGCKAREGLSSDAGRRDRARAALRRGRAVPRCRSRPGRGGKPSAVVLAVSFAPRTSVGLPTLWLVPLKERRPAGKPRHDARSICADLQEPPPAGGPRYLGHGRILRRCRP